MSGTPMYSFEVIRNGRKPVEVVVNEDGRKSIYLFGCFVTDSQIDLMLPRVVADRKATLNRKRDARRG
jgi:ASC-1-like (ASCH) protein